MDKEPIEALDDAAAGLQDSLQKSVDEIEERVHTTRDQLHELNEQAVAFIQQRPVAAIGIAFGVGYIIGKLAAKRWLV